jgi:mRNA-degrading endonuclease YafQ of YafQ-DinJ toxin-antitoxin module
MVEIAFESSFKRSYRRKVAGNQDRERRFKQKLTLFQNNPFETSLRTHKLSGRLNELWSFSVEYDLRIVFYFAEENKAVFTDIGTHDEVY